MRTDPGREEKLPRTLRPDLKQPQLPIFGALAGLTRLSMPDILQGCFNVGDKARKPVFHRLPEKKATAGVCQDQPPPRTRHAHVEQPPFLVHVDFPVGRHIGQ